MRDDISQILKEQSKYYNRMANYHSKKANLYLAGAIVCVVLIIFIVLV